MAFEADLVKILYAEAAHRNPAGGPKQQRLHGHTYRVEILAHGEVDSEIGWLVDYGDMKRFFEPFLAQLDHGFLNGLPGLETDTTLPALEQWIVEHFENAEEGKPAWFTGVRVAIAGDLAFKPRRLAAEPGLPARVGFSFEAAQSLPQLPEGHPCRQVHGHSYWAEAAAEDLDALETLLGQLYETLDHQYLNEIPGLEKATCERIGRWMWRWLESEGQRPSAIVVQETASARCVYRG